MIKPNPASRGTLVDWQTLPPDAMARLYAIETERWMAHLDWDTAAGWQEVERGRTLGTVSGLAVVDDKGNAAGWTFFLLHGTTLQVGGFVASSDPIAQMLLDHILTSPLALSAKATTIFAFADAPGLAASLRSRGLSVDRYWYLSRDLERKPPMRTSDIRSWRIDDVKATAELFQRAYGKADEARPFAPASTPEEWAAYAAQLATGAGCGTILPDACFAIPGGPGRLHGVSLTTRIAETTAHLAQLAVEPSMQSRQMGSRLVEMACTAAAQAGCRKLTLLVGGKNSRARSLYERLKFESSASFLAAGTLQPRRSTSVAPGGAVITRR